jgi:hypothetical protein
MVFRNNLDHNVKRDDRTETILLNIAKPSYPALADPQLTQLIPRRNQPTGIAATSR